MSLFFISFIVFPILLDYIYSLFSCIVAISYNIKYATCLNVFRIPIEPLRHKTKSVHFLF